MVGVDAKTREYVKNPTSCAMCRRMIINAGISKVVVRIDKTKYDVVNVRDWVFNDDSMAGEEHV